MRSTVLEAGDTKHVYKVSFTRVAHVCKVFLRLPTEEDRINIAALLRNELVPILKLEGAIRECVVREEQEGYCNVGKDIEIVWKRLEE